jgi:Ca2+-binding EF-hand superfamily protein
MRKLAFRSLALIAAIMFVGQVSAQPPGGPGGPGPGGGRPIPPVMAALDTDNNGEISAKELENAAKALAALDKNKDGKLTEEELRPEMGRGGPGGGGGGGFGGAGGFNPDEMFARMDTNKDGKIGKDELPEGRAEFVMRADADKDGSVTKEEWTKSMEEMRSRGRQGGAGGAGGGGFGGGFGGGPPNPEAMADRMMTFDADKDGKLSKEELLKYAEQMGRGYGGGRERDGNRPGRPDGDGKGRDGKDRPKRPQ